MDNHFHHLMARNTETTDMETEDKFMLSLPRQIWDIRLLLHTQLEENILLLTPMLPGEGILLPIPMQQEEGTLLPIPMEWDRKPSNMPNNNMPVTPTMRRSGAGAGELISFCQC